MFNYQWPFTAQLAMYLWPPVVLYVLMRRKAAFERTAFALFVIAMLALPMLIKFDLPSVPPISKEGSTILAILLFCLWRQRKRIKQAKPFRGMDLFVVISMVAAIGTASTNKDPLEYGSWITTHIQGLTFKDAISLGIRDFVVLFLPFFLGRMLFRTTDDLEEMIKILAVAGLWYSLACLVEIRLSPQIHRWIYGYAPHTDFAQTIRWGGFRPMICMAHGLAVAMFMTAATMSAGIMTRFKHRLTRFRLTAKTSMFYLGIILVACKSTGAIIYAFVFVPTVWKAKPKNIVRVALALATFVAVYPTLRAFDLFPTQKVVETAKSAFGADRAQSIEFRFKNENLLLEKAMSRQWFGWGGYGRGRIYDWEMGKEVTIADGQWIIVLSRRGIVGSFCFFALLLGPIFAMRKRLRKIKDKRERTLAAGATLILAVYCLDMVPNASYSVIPFILAGALWTISQNMVKGTASAPAQPAAYPYGYPASPAPAYYGHHPVQQQPPR